MKPLALSNTKTNQKPSLTGIIAKGMFKMSVCGLLFVLSAYLIVG